MLTTALPIETPEGISFNYELASLSDRGLAYLIDLAIRLVAVLVIGLVLLLLLGPALLGGMGVWLVLVFALEWGYYVLFELIWDGQSPGKRLLGLRVLKVAGHPVGFYDSALRNLLRAADLLPFTYATAAISVLASRRFQRLGDLAADTIVVREQREWYGGEPAPGDAHAPGRTGQGGRLSAPPAAPTAAVLRAVQLSQRERRLLQEFVHRSPRLHPDRREELAAILANPYSRRFRIEHTPSASALLTQIAAAASDREKRL